MQRTMTALTLVLILAATTPGLAQGWVAKQQTAEGKLRVLGDATYEFVGSEFSFSNEVVKGAPYSADAVTETTQVLGDGNRITRKTIARAYRDSEGRTRREQELPAIGSWVPDAGEQELITISDPVGGFSYSLNPESMEAHKMGRPKFNVVIRTSPDGENAPGVTQDRKMVLRTSSATFTREPNVFIEKLHEVSPAGGIERIQVAPIAEGSEPVSESLGDRMIEGVQAEGTRTVVTIPAGRIGNELPIEIVTERWFSPELETVVMRRHYDPRFGETLYRLENIDLSEPDPALFEVPAEFTIKEGGNSFIHLKKQLHELKEGLEGRNRKN